jgi:isocitrate lyase
MTAYVRLQEREFEMEPAGYSATRHQREVGTGYFDQVSDVITGGLGSTLALRGSTEEAQFDASKASANGDGKKKAEDQEPALD